MLAAVAWLVANALKERLAYFFFAVGVGDIFYYFWLKLFLNWPPSLLTFDILFLIPVPWVSPVLASLLASLLFILTGASLIILEELGKSWQFNHLDIFLLLLAAVITVLSFTINFKTLIASANPSFNWELFLAGYALGLFAFSRAFFKFSK